LSGKNHQRKIGETGREGHKVRVEEKSEANRHSASGKKKKNTFARIPKGRPKKAE